jgi:hypothetical protein
MAAISGWLGVSLMQKQTPDFYGMAHFLGSQTC